MGTVVELDKTREAELIRKAKAGDRNAFEELIRTHTGRLYALAMHLCKNSADADDCFQETMIKIYRYLPRFMGKCTFSTWTYRIMYNTCLDMFRHEKKRKGDVSIDDENSFASPLEAPEEENPEIRILRTEHEKAFNRLVERLPEKIRSAFVLRDVHHLSYEQISEVQDIPLGTVRSRIHRARERMMELISEDKTGSFDAVRR